MSNIVAAIGRGQLTVLDERVERKREIFLEYRKLLRGIGGLYFMPEAGYGRSNHWLTCITIDEDKFGADRETIRIVLEESNIESRPLWKPMHLQPLFEKAEIIGGSVSEELFDVGLCLPSGTNMTDDDIGRVAAIIRETGVKGIESRNSG